MKESEWQQQVIDLGKMTGWTVAHFRSVCVARADGSYYYATPVQADGEGFPDLLMIRVPVLVVAELKIGRNVTSPQQRQWLADFKAVQKVEIAVWKPENWDEVVKVLGR